MIKIITRKATGIEQQYQDKPNRRQHSYIAHL
jgi:hypothetical protein